jgi:Icc-related predicted phosphoesterase
MVPPRGILDPGGQELHVGSTALTDAVRTRQIAHHVFGHLHDAGGQTVQRGATTFHNVAACNEEYVLVNQPKIIELSS